MTRSLPRPLRGLNQIDMAAEMVAYTKVQGLTRTSQAQQRALYVGSNGIKTPPKFRLGVWSNGTKIPPKFRLDVWCTGIKIPPILGELSGQRQSAGFCKHRVNSPHLALAVSPNKFNCVEPIPPVCAFAFMFVHSSGMLCVPRRGLSTDVCSSQRRHAVVRASECSGETGSLRSWQQRAAESHTGPHQGESEMK